MPGTPGPEPTRIAHYHLRRVIAFGGMSTVYEAVDETLRRTVAFKVMKSGLESESEQKRFQSEARILARLRHPAIAQVFDAGTYDEGGRLVPYFVMEYIPNARPITEYVRAKNLGVREKLRLFAEVCDAVHHGHQHDVVHRDLKPENVLVDSSDQPKIIDFGVARATDPDVGLLDAHGQLIGTLQSMSPEQVEPDPRDIDARSDVYALGAMLYEMLCDQPPYDVPHDDIPEARRIIRQQEPPRISTLNPALRGDLEAIVHTALQKNRNRRYESARDLASDIRHWLADEPIQARGSSAFYVLRAQARRSLAMHPVASLLAIVLIATSAGRFVATPLVFEWTPANEVFERVITALFGLNAAQQPFDATRVVAFTDKTDMAAIAEGEGIAGVEADDVKSQRRVHGKLMEKLAQSGALVVVWDVTFIDESPHDELFVQGAKALRAAGIPVVVAVRTWEPDEEGLPYVSDNILPHVLWGGVSARFDAASPWRLDLIVQGKRRDPTPSIALAALTSSQHPEAEVSLELDSIEGVIVVRHWRRLPEIRQARRMVGQAIRIELSDVAIDRGLSVESGIKRGDVVGRYLIGLPDDEALSAATVEYADVFSASVEQLRDWFSGRAIVIGCARAGTDIYAYPDGRMIHGCFGHASAIDSLLRSVSVRMPRPWHIWVLLIVSSLLGALVPVVTGPRTATRVGLLAVLVVLALVGSGAAYRHMDYLCNPLVPLLAVVVASELSAIVLRWHVARHR
jgi:CHASE2 domain-containing sensor protein